MKLDDKIKWCFKQKAGIRIVEPSDNLCEAYLKKANNSLKAMQVNLKANVREWAIATAYYARYHSIYALLIKCGIKSEIHDCSISLVKYLFSSDFSNEMMDELEKAKQQRIDVQYYTDRTIENGEFKDNISSAPDFVLNAEKVINSFKNERIKEIRTKLEKLK